MYRVIVRVFLVGRNGMMGLSRQLTLPFVPFPGLLLHGLAADCEEEEMGLAVGWNPAEACFYAELPDWQDAERGIADLIDHFGPGWELNEPGEVYHEAS